MNNIEAFRTLLLDTIKGDLEQSIKYINASEDAISRAVRSDFKVRAKRKLESAIEIINKLNGPTDTHHDFKPRPNQEL